MRVLIVGNGGREHALAWAISRSPRVERLDVAPGNGGTATVANNVGIAADDIDGLLAYVVEHGVDLTVVGPEAPLVAGVVDRFAAAGQRCFGPTAAGARLEGSKVFAKEFMKRHGIPTAAFAVCDDAEEARKRVREIGAPVVVKADGLAAGKGVVVALTLEEADGAVDDIMIAKQFGESGTRVVVEEFLRGQEVSMHSICGGGRAIPFPSSQDHKRAFAGDKGPNTGGMGAYAPVPFVDAQLAERVYETIVMRTLRGMESDGIPFCGVLYTGLMITPDGPKVLEYNVRFGDPETQVLLPLLKADLFEVLYESAGNALPDRIEFHDGLSAAAVVMASEGYPGHYKKGAAISGLGEIDSDNRVVFHAGTRCVEGKFATNGGRVLAVTAWAPNLAGAIYDAYAGVGTVRFDGAFWREDVGRRALQCPEDGTKKKKVEK